MKCIKCGAGLTNEMFTYGTCFSCGCSGSGPKEAFTAEQSRLKAGTAYFSDRGGNAIIGISYGFMTFSGNMMGVSVTGTSVKIEKCVDDL